MTTISHDQDNKTLNVPVSSLIALKASGLTLPEHATRDIDKEHVFNLSETDPTQWPSIEVVETEHGLAVIDGNHRWHALVRQVTMEVLGLLEAKRHDQDLALGRITAEQRTQIDAKLDETLIPAHFGIYRSDKEVAKAALTANLKHGLPPKSKALVHIAVELYDVTRGESPEPSQADIARLVGISRATLNEYLKKREKDLEKEAQAVEGEEGEGEVAAKPEKSALEKYMKRVEKLMHDLDTDPEVTPDVVEAVSKKLFPVVITNMHDAYHEKDEHTYGEGLREAMGVASDVDASQLHYIKRLSGALSSWMRTSAAKAKKSATAKKGTPTGSAQKVTTSTPKKGSSQEDSLFVGPHGEPDHNYMDNYLS